MAIETLKGVEKIDGFNVVVMDELREKYPEKFNEKGGMDYKWFESDIRPKNFIYVRHDVNSIAFTIQKGQVKENGVNGCQVDTIIHAAKMILDGFNKNIPCKETEQASEYLRLALLRLEERKKDRDMVPMEKPLFKDSEFECKCGCGTNNVHPELLARLIIARKKADIPFVINCGCRCRKHNAEVKGAAADSSHLASKDKPCLAVDIRVTDGVSRFKILKALIEAGFTRIGIGLGLIHADIDPNKIQSDVWVYQGK